MDVKIKPLADTYASGRPLKVGKVETVSSEDAAILIRMGKAIPVKDDPELVEKQEVEKSTRGRKPKAADNDG